MGSILPVNHAVSRGQGAAAGGGAAEGLPSGCGLRVGGILFRARSFVVVMVWLDFIFYFTPCALGFNVVLLLYVYCTCMQERRIYVCLFDLYIAGVVCFVYFCLFVCLSCMPHDM